MLIEPIVLSFCDITGWFLINLCYLSRSKDIYSERSWHLITVLCLTPASSEVITKIYWVFLTSNYVKLFTFIMSFNPYENTNEIDFCYYPLLSWWDWGLERKFGQGPPSIAMCDVSGNKWFNGGFIQIGFTISDAI